MSDFEKWFRNLNANGKTVYFLGNEHQVSEMAWNHQQTIIDNLKAQLNNMEACYIEKKKERDELLGRVAKAQGCFQDFYSTGYHVHIFEADEALRGAND